MNELIIAIDAGTTGVRSILFTTAGTVLAKAYEEFDSLFPSPSWVEQEAPNWWTSACKTIQRCLKSVPFGPDNVVAVSVTNQRETVVPLDDTGRPLRHAIVWQDRRTTPQCEWIRENISADTIYSITGLTIDPYFTAPKILWVKEHQPDIFSKTDKFLLVHDFIIHRLTDNAVTDFSNASRTMLFDLKSGTWSKKLLDAFEIPVDSLPKPVPSGTKVGEVTSKAAKLSSLAEGTPVVTGGGDQQCAALGVGVIREGMIKSTTGTGTFILAHSDSIRLDSHKRVLCSRHVLTDAFVVEASMFTTGSVLRWFRDQFGRDECIIAEKKGIDPYEVLVEEAASIPPGSEGVMHIPHLVGAGAPYWNPHARGVFAGLALGHTRNHLIRAILEGVSYEIRNNLDVMRELDITASEVRVTGGAARSEVWMQIQADVLGIPIVRTELEEATALGAAILACKGIGKFKSITEAAEQMIHEKPPLIPNQENQSLYDAGFKRYKQLYQAISQLK
jgi:D-xylulose kinase